MHDSQEKAGAPRERSARSNARENLPEIATYRNTSVDLLAEATAGEMLTAKDFGWLKENGVEIAGFAAASSRAPIRIIRAQPLPSDTYALSLAGQKCLQIAVMRKIEIEPFGNFPIEIDEVHDLVAISFKQPWRLRRRTGRAWALGTELLFQDRPVDVVETPLEWLSAGGDALCILNWSPSSKFQMLHEALELRVASGWLEKQLKASLSLSGGPTIVRAR